MRSTRPLFFLAFLALVAPRSLAQLGELFSPGPLAKAHAHLEGADQCVQCHQQGKRVSAARCLACHKPVAERIAAKKGVHRDATDCVSCHVEHAGRDADLRPFDTRRFDHSITGFLLDGRHAQVACERCHRTRSFLTLSASCASCHKDPHQGRLGNECTKCHSTSAPFRETSRTFDHAKTAFPLQGSHRALACAKCHTGGRYQGVKHASCADCHRSPHKSPVGTECSSCHPTTAATWKVASFDHARTGVALRGGHASVACARCHTKPATQVRLKLRPCAACHKDPHNGSFPQDCATCHDERAFKGAPFDHAEKTRFPLIGRHRQAACSACHKKAGDFRGLSMQCASCHKDVHAAKLGTACEQCHTTETFRLATFTHPRFPEFFGGRHAAVSCDQCHRGAVAARVYRTLSTDCASCHKDPHAAQMPRCTDCHTVADVRFVPSRFDHGRTKFPLTGKHAAVACAQCHAKKADVVQFTGTGTACASCHKDPHAGTLGTSCDSCHDTASFRVARYAHRNPGAFFRGKHATAGCGDCHKSSVPVAVRFTGLGECSSCHKDPHRGQFGAKCGTCHRPDAAWPNASRAFHKAGRFPLEGRHLVVPCADCHIGGILKGTPTACYDCHWIRKQDDKYQTRLGNECESCHRPTSWTAVAWDHAARTSFALSGAHQALSCDQCHRGGTFGRTLSDCASCHLADYDGAREPAHRAAGFPLTCQVCHSAAAASWKGARFDHATFSLAGVHASQPCAACHRNSVYAGTPRECVGCHRADYERTADPAHAAAGFTVACETCHRMTDTQWSAGTYQHTIWPLLGRHNTVARCNACHTSGRYAGQSSDCVSCHRPDFERASNPNHIAASFPTTCLTCHQVADMTWDQGRFTHSTFTLAGVHATQLCGACHRNGVFAGTARECAGCHQKDFDSAREPNHIAAGFPTACEPCHRGSDATWKQGVFAHASFPLAGVHATRACADCHTGGVYRGTSRSCSGCHQPQYTAAQNPNHVTAGFPTTCENCHKFSDASWNQGVFRHDTFALAGVHATQPCAQCHRNGVYRGTPRTCAGCHQAEYSATRDPNHVTAGFPTTCENCHKFSDTSWNQGVFRHDTFALAGVHATQPCAQCHRNGVYRGTPRTCAGCHQADYNAARDPNHVTAGFPTTCETCHRFSDTSWNQGVFRHDTFALAGVHATQPCAQCHRNGVYRGTPRTCAGCHQSAYDATRDPNHLAAGFPTTCETCHRYTDTSWSQGRFNHTWFPITSGKHSGRACSECHTSTSTFQLFSCTTGCHGRSETDGHHREVAGYRYDSLACYACHPQGRAD